MSITTEYLIVGLVPVALLAINAQATRRVLQDDLSEPKQRLAQFGMIWFVPLLGSLMVLAMHREPPAPSGQYSQHLYYEDGGDGCSLLARGDVSDD
ncbi:hypothetical protein [Massilia sp. CF038]|uniref:hypothetical protein n=1 Tax=Massilia sp. CF038 TaxID=1881045 RepID=UPI000923B448|nr:hypothetical protein [Massilia sp. CF038]SHG77329.1 hypothetical protein SAMN05428948_1974 [Massilia sp. CF038]